MPLSREEVLHIAQLVRIGVTPADVEKFQDQLSHILDQFEVLRPEDARQGRHQLGVLATEEAIQEVLSAEC